MHIRPPKLAAPTLLAGGWAGVRLLDKGSASGLNADPLAMPDLCVVPDVGNWGAPCVMVALTGPVHDRQAAAGH
jgi:hypothetical protein